MSDQRKPANSPYNLRKRKKDEEFKDNAQNPDPIEDKRLACNDGDNHPLKKEETPVPKEDRKHEEEKAHLWNG